MNRFVTYIVILLTLTILFAVSSPGWAESVVPSEVVAEPSAADLAPEHGNPHPGMGLLLQSLNFAILMTALYFLLRKPVAEYFAARSAALRYSVEQSQKEHEKALAEHKQIESRLKNVDQEASELLQNFKEEALLESNKIIDQANLFTAKISQDAKRIVQSEIVRANEELRELTIKHTRDLAEKLIAKEITPEDEERLLNNYLARLDKM